MKIVWWLLFLLALPFILLVLYAIGAMLS